jgi:hypothetical protein
MCIKRPFYGQFEANFGLMQKKSLLLWLQKGVFYLLGMLPYQIIANAHIALGG